MFEPSQLRLTPFGYLASHPSVVSIVVCCLLLPTKDILLLWIPANLSEVGTTPFLCQIYARSTPGTLGATGEGLGSREDSESSC